ncbi:MAG: hypothetical protein QGI45_04185 [Myxococcota bacterium]|jgi:hypothetical protein|nr:hypothetical protein [Myxococcota bacterium]
MSDSQNDLPELDVSAILEIHPQPSVSPVPQPPQAEAAELPELEDISLGDLDDIFDDVVPPGEQAGAGESTELDLESLSLAEESKSDTPTPMEALEEESTGEFDISPLADDLEPSETPPEVEKPDRPRLPTMDFSNLDIETGQIESPFPAETPPDPDAPIIPITAGEPPGISALNPEDLPETMEAVQKLVEQKAAKNQAEPSSENADQARAAFLAAMDGEAFHTEDLPQPKILLMCMIRVMANTMGNREDFIDALENIIEKSSE